MRGILFNYELEPTTWVYLSSLMTIGIYFKFRRFWSVRNLDLIALIVFSPGLVLVLYGLEFQAVEFYTGDVEARLGEVTKQYGVEFQTDNLEQCVRELAVRGRALERLGYIWLFGVGAFYLIRLLLDSVMVRRPLLRPNLSAGGLAFTGAALLVFLLSNVITGKLAEGDLVSAQRPIEVPVETENETPPETNEGQTPAKRANTEHLEFGHPLFYEFADRATQAMAEVNGDPAKQPTKDVVRRATIGRTTVIVAHLALVLGMVLIGYRHFGNIETGVATASLYLLLPYTAQMTAQVHHVVPAALLVWAVQAYRRPVVAGILVGLAGVVFYPLFLLPLWCSFYWRRGLIRFVAGVVSALIVLVALLALDSSSPAAFGDQLQQMFGFTVLRLGERVPVGFWSFFEPAYRIPVIAAFGAMVVGLALWPAQKNLGTLLSCSAAVMLGSQFWHPDQGGLCMAWYLPLLLLTVFRPNLEDRVAISALAEVSIRRRKSHTADRDRAALQAHRAGGAAGQGAAGQSAAGEAGPGESGQATKPSD